MRYAMLMIGLLTAACGSDFDPRSKLDGYRVVGVAAEPPEVGPEDTVRLTVHDLDTDGGVPAYRWTLCLYSVGATVEFACADPRLEFSVEGGRDAEIDLSAYGIRALVEAAGGVPAADGTLRTLEDGFDVYVTVESGPPTGRQIRTVKRVRVREGGEPNRNPAATLAIEPTDLRRGGEVTLRVVPAPGAAEQYVDAETGEAARETLTFSWYATGGEIESPITDGEDTETPLALPDEPGPVDVVVAVRDGRGGLAVVQGRVEVP